MNKNTIRNVTEAHGWLGIIFSVVLFIIFWAGSVSFFYPELKSWAATPQHVLTEQRTTLNADDVMAMKLEEYQVDLTKRINLFYPSETLPYYRLGMVIENQDGASEYDTLLINPYNGETLYSENQFHFASFLFRLHYTLQLPFGNYLVGIVSLFLLILVISGLFIQLKKLVSEFFLYRASKTKRYQFLDLHRVVGVITLPYSLLFALTGLMLNLAILFQAATVVLFYQGSQQQLVQDAGFVLPQKPAEFISHTMPDLEVLKAATEQQFDVDVFSFQFFFYGDQSAMIRMRSEAKDNFVDRQEVYYNVKDQRYSKQPDQTPNSFTAATRFLYTLHFAHFADISARIIYFILGIAVCGMIVVGNLLWLEKHAKNHKRTNQLLTAGTIGGCCGIVFATCAGFLLERILPANLDHRGTFVEGSFFVIFLAVLISGFWLSHGKHIVKYTARTSALLLFSLVAIDLIWFGNNIVTLWQNGYTAAAGMNAGFLITASLLYWLSCKIRLPKQNEKTHFEGSAQAG